MNIAMNIAMYIAMNVTMNIDMNIETQPPLCSLPAQKNRSCQLLCHRRHHWSGKKKPSSPIFFITLDIFIHPCWTTHAIWHPHPKTCCQFFLLSDVYQSISSPILLLQSVDVIFYFCEASDSPPYILIFTNCLDGIGMNILWVRKLVTICSSVEVWK